MVAPDFLLQLAVILLIARLAGEIAIRLGAPSVIGELVAGIVLGPSVLGWIEPTEIIRLLAEIGIILLLFEVGLDSDVARLARSGRRSVLVAVAGVITPFVLGYAAARHLFGQDVLVAMFIGGTLTATSIGVTVRVLRDIGRQNSREGQVVVGAAVLDDLFGVLLLSMLYEFSRSGQVGLAHLGRVTLFVGAFFLLAPLIAKAISVPISRYRDAARVPGIIATTIVSLVLLFAWVAEALGAPQIVGGFAAGLALSRRFTLPFGASLAQDARFSDEVRRTMKPIGQIFIPIFFVTVGLSVDLREVDWGSAFIWFFSITITVAAIVGKLASGLLLFRERWLVRCAIGMAMVPRGEVGLIFAELGRSSGIFDSSIYTGMVLVIAYTTLFSPFWIKLFYRRYGRHADMHQSTTTQ